MTQIQFFVALGANLKSPVGNPAETIIKAVGRMPFCGLEVLQKSRLYSTPCFPRGAGPDYVNAVVSVGADLTPYEVLDRLHSIEAEFGRLRDKRWGARGIDVDLLARADCILPDRARYLTWRHLSPQAQTELAPEELILPHPRIQDRSFVLVPFAEIAPNWVHPVLNLSVRQMLDALDPADRAEVVPLSDGDVF